MCWPREVQSSIPVAKESWGLLSSDCRANRPGGEIFAPCYGTSTAHENDCAEDTTEPYIIDWQIFEPKGIRAEDQQQKKENLEVLTCESRRFAGQSHRYYNEYKVQRVRE